LHELGNLQYADGNLGEAEIIWNDCVDTIFQRLYVVNQFRQVFADNDSLGDAFGTLRKTEAQTALRIVDAIDNLHLTVTYGVDGVELAGDIQTAIKDGFPTDKETNK